MRPIIQKDRTSSKKASPRSRGALAHLSDFGNDKLKPQKVKKFNWDHALVTSDDSSYTGQVENKPCRPAQGNTKKRNEQSYDGTTFGILSLQIEGQSSDDSNNKSHAKDSHRAKNVPLALLRIAEEVDDEIVFEHSFNSPLAPSVNHMLSALSPQSGLSSKNGNGFSRSDDHTDLATDIAGNLTSMRAQKDNDAASIISWPASDINSNLTPRGMKHNDTMDLMSFFSEPATEIMGNLTSAGLRRDRTTDSSLHGEQFLAGVETQMDDESLFSEEDKGVIKSEDLVSKPTETPKISNRVAPGSEADKSIISNMSKQTSTTAKSKGKADPKGGKVVSRWRNQKDDPRERVSGSHNLTVPDGSDDATEKKGTVDQSEKITTKPRSTFCVTFVVGSLLAIVAGLVCIVVGLPTLVKDAKASTSPNFSGSGERSRTIWNLAVSVSVSGSNSLNEMSSPVFQAYDWMLRNDSISVKETSSEMLKERLVLAILFFATSGAEWNEKLNFLSGKSICAWNNSDEKLDLSVGVFCDIQSRVKHIILGKFILGSLCHVDSIVNSNSFDHEVGNSLRGTVPVEVSQLEYLQILDLCKLISKRKHICETEVKFSRIVPAAISSQRPTWRYS